MTREPEIGFFRDPVKKKSELRRSLELLLKVFMTLCWVVLTYTFTWYFAHTAAPSIRGQSFESVVFTLMIIGFSAISALPLLRSDTQDKILYIMAAGMLMIFSTAVSLGLIAYSPEKIVQRLEYQVTGIRQQSTYELESDVKQAEAVIKRRGR